ncbi:MAG: hypothetical protein AB7H80_14175 [Candidatus Kapaibacterium sp.]
MRKSCICLSSVVSQNEAEQNEESLNVCREASSPQNGNGFLDDSVSTIRLFGFFDWYYSVLEILLCRRVVGRGMFFAIALLLSCMVSSCSAEREKVDHAFYEWRSEVSYSPADLALFDSLKVDKLYVRFFDVQWHEGNAQPYPESIARFRTSLPKGVEIIPTVYVTVELMRRATERFSLEELAEKIVRKIESMSEAANIPLSSIREIQLDCDWTASTRWAYFDLLRNVKKLKPEWLLSSTIRLHQVKYRVETGVPPVDRGMLMAYNAGQVTAIDERNSIFTEEEVEKYLGPLSDYPLPLDAALPIFSWGVRFHFDRFAAIIDNIGMEEMAGRAEFQQVGENLWQAEANTEIRGEPIYAGDIIRIEEPSRKEVLAIAEEIASKIDQADITLSLYRFDPAIIKRSRLDYLQSLYRVFE